VTSRSSVPVLVPVLESLVESAENVGADLVLPIFAVVPKLEMLFSRATVGPNCFGEDRHDAIHGGDKRESAYEA
jgi:hypothetical protein